jgi:hypothetical protein
MEEGFFKSRPPKNEETEGYATYNIELHLKTQDKNI